MPELPEVETLRRGLHQYLVGLTIIDIDVRLTRVFTGDKQALIAAKIIDVKRYGKGLVIELNNGYSMAVHVKMTGQLIYQGAKQTEVSKDKVGTIPNKFTHIIFQLKEKSEHREMDMSIPDAYLYYNDIRQFGWVKVVRTDQIKSLPFFKELGPEPFTGLTFAKFQTILSSSKTAIKPLLMDQKKIGGIGNIYANDALYLANILPTRPANSLHTEEQKKLFDAIEEVLRRGLHYGGASELTFVNVLGQEGTYQEHFLVYGQQGKTCNNCGATIKKSVLGGRGTYYCPGCQK